MVSDHPASPARSDALRRYREAVARTDALIDPAPSREKTLAAVQARATARMTRLRAFLASLGDPHRRFPIVHVGGTSGKGSTSAAIAAILTAAGYRTGLHTSPYLQVATEKLAIDGQLIEAGEFAVLIDELLAAAAAFGGAAGEAITYGELWFALVAAYLSRHEVDIAVIEVGAGGRFDLTNVVAPILSVITSVGIDHTETLGSTIAEIAWHKAGIIKPGIPAVSAVREPVPAAIIAAEAAEAGSKIIETESIAEAAITVKADGRAVWSDRTGTIFTAGMPGRFQIDNAMTAVAAARTLGAAGWNIGDQHIQRGIARARLPGRCETVGRGPRVILDGAHNAQKIGALADDLAAIAPRPPGGRLIVVLGALDTKDHAAIVLRLAETAHELIVTRPRVLAKPGADPATLGLEARTAGFRGQLLLEPDPDAAIELALSRAESTRGDIILVTGSLYLVGNLRERWFPGEEIVLQRTQWPVVDAG